LAFAGAIDSIGFGGWAGIIILLFHPAYEVIIQPRQHNSIVSTKRQNTSDSAASQSAAPPVDWLFNKIS